MTTNANASGQLYRVTFVKVGGRRTKTVDAAELEFLQSAWYLGIRVTSYREI